MILRHMWTVSNHCTNPSPFFIVLGNEYCYGIFADNTYKTTFIDFGYEEYRLLFHRGMRRAIWTTILCRKKIWQRW